MSSSALNRRDFLNATAALASGLYAGPLLRAAGPAQKNDRLRVGAIGLRYQGSVIAEKILPYGDLVALCDVDRQILDATREKFARAGNEECFIHQRETATEFFLVLDAHALA